MSPVRYSKIRNIVGMTQNEVSKTLGPSCSKWKGKRLLKVWTNINLMTLPVRTITRMKMYECVQKKLIHRTELRRLTLLRRWTEFSVDVYHSLRKRTFIAIVNFWTTNDLSSCLNACQDKSTPDKMMKEKPQLSSFKNIIISKQDWLIPTDLLPSLNLQRTWKRKLTISLR